MKLLDLKQLSEKIQVPVKTLYNWTSMKKIPYIKMRGQLRFDEEEIDRWIKGMRVAILS